MTLRLPEPLPYDYVDELLDNDYVWATAWFMDTEDELGNVYPEEVRMTYSYARRLDEQFRTSVSNYPNPFMEVKGEINYDAYAEDKEGYIDFPSEYGFSWTAEEWDDQKVDEYLKLLDRSSF